MRLFRVLAPLIFLAPVCSAQLTKGQKLADFNQLASLYAVNYAPYELKRDVFSFDLLNLQPWLDQVGASKTDIDFYDICVKYVASLQDSHDEFTIQSDFDAWLHMDGDIYDGKFLIDFIDRSYLTRAKYPFTTGDELISVDGTPIADLLKTFSPYSVNGMSNPVSRQRLAAATITERYQGWNPRAGDIGATATIVVQRQSGQTETYTILWDVTGTKLTNVGIVPVPHAIRETGPREGRIHQRGGDTGPRNPWGVWTGAAAQFDPEPIPAYMAPLTQLGNMSAAAGPANYPNASGLSPFGSKSPLFNPPSNFVARLGAKSTDLFLSGTMKSGANTLGFIRIPTFSPSSTTVGLQQFAAEVAYFQQNTDGLIVDVMANGGGSICYTQNLVANLIPFTFRGAAEQLRATLNWRINFASSVNSAKVLGAPQWIVDLYSAYLAEINQALAENRALTGSLPLCSYTFDAVPPTTSAGVVQAYTKPILLLTDNFTLSSAELFTMFLQDNQRATVFGMRTDGGGGNVVSIGNATNYSQANTRMTEGLITRLRPVASPGYAASIYTDGWGVYPDIIENFMTADNLQSGGATFLNNAISAMNTLIAKGK